MPRLGQVVLQSLVGACAGAIVGVVGVGLLGGLSGIPYLISHPGKDGPVVGFLAGVVMYGLFMGLPLGAPIGFIIGLIAGGIRGSRSRAATARKTAPPLGDLADERDLDKTVCSARPSSSSPSLFVATALLLALPGGLLVVWLTYGMWERARFDRFAGEVARLGGTARNAALESPFPVVEAIDLDLSSTAIDDVGLERLARDPMFKRVVSLNLAGTRVTDRGVAVFGDRPWFSYLDLSHTPITDLGLASIPRCCPNTLNLSGTRVTDATLQLIERQGQTSPNRSIDLTDTGVTGEEVRRLGKVFTMMNIKYGSSKSPEHTR